MLPVDEAGFCALQAQVFRPKESEENGVVAGPFIRYPFVASDQSSDPSSAFRRIGHRGASEPRGEADMPASCLPRHGVYSCLRRKPGSGEPRREARRGEAPAAWLGSARLAAPLPTPRPYRDLPVTPVTRQSAVWERSSNRTRCQAVHTEPR
ncbi:unnamed protein product [Gadus morhua 'NCC']